VAGTNLENLIQHPRLSVGHLRRKDTEFVAHQDKTTNHHYRVPRLLRLQLKKVFTLLNSLLTITDQG